ncbi:hypothetical protein JCM3770_005789 [Rhodotorula araucariae]
MFGVAQLPLVALLAASVAQAAVTPTAPWGGNVFNVGDRCNIEWDLDTTGTWTDFSITLMTGSNLAMVPLQTVASGLDGTKGATTMDYTCPDVTPNAAIYFYQFEQAGQPTSWTTRFTIAAADGTTTKPMQSTGGIAWGTGSLVGSPSSGSGSSAAGPAAVSSRASSVASSAASIGSAVVSTASAEESSSASSADETSASSDAGLSATDAAASLVAPVTSTSSSPSSSASSSSSSASSSSAAASSSVPAQNQDSAAGRAGAGAGAAAVAGAVVALIFA